MEGCARIKILVRKGRSETTVSIQRRNEMIWTIFLILVVLWFLGLASSYTAGGLIHLLLVLAVAVVLIRILQGRRAV
jgi:hypothetical protein